MKKQLLSVALAMTLVAGVSATDINDLKNGLNTFVNDATKSLPFAASAGLDWSDAWIGNVVDVPPHFGLGVGGGFTSIPGGTVKPLITALGGDTGGFNDLPLPFLVLNGRVGGFVLPFDVGFKVGYFPAVTVSGYTINYQNYGVDFRYALVKGDVLWPTISVGVGVDYMKASVEASYGSALSYSDANYTLNATAPKATLDVSALAFEAKAQVSKTFLFILTPYVGLAAGSGSATAKAGVSSNLTTTAPSLSYWDKYLGSVTAAGFSKDNTSTPIGFRIYGGTSINIFLLKLDLQGLYNVVDGGYGLSAGLRFQL